MAERAEQAEQRIEEQGKGPQFSSAVREARALLRQDS